MTYKGAWLGRAITPELARMRPEAQQCVTPGPLPDGNASAEEADRHD